MWIIRSIGSGACVTMVPISRYFLFFFSGPADHRTLVFQLVASMYSACVRSVHYSNAPPTSKLFGGSCIECSFGRCSSFPRSFIRSFLKFLLLKISFRKIVFHSFKVMNKNGVSKSKVHTCTRL